MANIQRSYETKLESADKNHVIAILDAKLEATSPERTADYVSLALDNIDSAIKRMKDGKDTISTLFKEVLKVFK